MTSVRTLVAAAVVASISLSAEAQPQSADERAIRDLIARYDEEGRRSVPHTDDTIYWTGEFRTPTVGSQTPEPLPPGEQPSATRAPGAPSERVPGGRRRVTTPVRIEIAASGDMAYEFSHSEVVFALRNGERETATPASVLRVWKKDGGQWKIAAMFARPHYLEAVPANAK